MRFNCGETEKEARRSVEPYYCNWHDWFAWYPVRVGYKDCRWLEVIERKAGYVGSGLLGIIVNAPCDCMYRAKEKPTENNDSYRKLEGYFPW